MNQRLLKNNYSVLNLVFIGIILSVFAYSFIYSAEERPHPLPSGAGLSREQAVPSTGLSRSFSEIVRLDFTQARLYNPYGIRVFSFFFLQLVLRLTGIVLALCTTQQKLRDFVYTDIAISVFLFVFCFWPFLQFLIRQLT